MADRYWLGTTDAVYSTAANWSATSGGAPGGVKPGAGDDVYFDGAGDNPCTLDEATAAINSLSVHSAGDPGGAYTALLDFNDKAVNVTGGGNMTFDGTGEVKCGTGTMTCSGNFDNKDQGTWTRETSTLVMNGANKTITGANANPLYDLVISEDIELLAATSIRLSVRHDLTVDIGKTFTVSDTCYAGENSGTITISGTIDGLSTFESRSSSTTILTGTLSVSTWNVSGTVADMSGTSTPTLMAVRTLATLVGGTYGATNVTIKPLFGGVRTVTFGTGAAQTLIFTGDVLIDNDNTGTWQMDVTTHDPDIEFRGDLDLTETGGGTVLWQTGTGTVIFSAGAGTQEYTDSTAAIQVLGDVDHDGAGGTLKLITEMECDDFTGTAGTFDGNGQTLDCGGNLDWQNGYLFDDPVGSTFEVAGNFTANANDLSGASGGWTLSVAGTAVASGAGDVAHSDASGGTEIDASAVPWTDSGNNDNWNFGVAFDSQKAFIIGGGISL